jgi:hypothetical protein
MFSSKYLNYRDWQIAYNIIVVRKEHIGEKKLDTTLGSFGARGLYQSPRLRLGDDTSKKVEQIKNNMNNKRLIFTWDHLNNFY